MPSISDSSAILEKKRLLPQHQAALTLIQEQIVKPNITSFSWLDLCCGKGQIIINLEDNFTENQRKKIEYHIQDINEEYLKVTLKSAENLKFKKVESYTTDLEKFHKNIPENPIFDFITLINAVHEISPFFHSELFVECLIRLTEKGRIYIYDMENLNSPELGAITWTREEIQEFINSLLEKITLEEYKPTVNRWNHASCDAWSIELHKEFLINSAEIKKNKSSLIDIGNAKIQELLERKLFSCDKALESFTKYGTETKEDEEKRINMLFDFYSLTRILKK